jgi:hypothetical protein
MLISRLFFSRGQEHTRVTSVLAETDVYVVSRLEHRDPTRSFEHQLANSLVAGRLRWQEFCQRQTKLKTSGFVADLPVELEALETSAGIGRVH